MAKRKAHKDMKSKRVSAKEIQNSADLQASMAGQTGMKTDQEEERL